MFVRHKHLAGMFVGHKHRAGDTNIGLECLWDTNMGLGCTNIRRDVVHLRPVLYLWLVSFRKKSACG